MNVTFSLNYRTTYGENMYIRLNGKELIMEWSAGHVWTYTSKLIPNEDVTYSYLIKESKVVKGREPDFCSRNFHVSHQCYVWDIWGDPSSSSLFDTNSAFKDFIQLFLTTSPKPSRTSPKMYLPTTPEKSMSPMETEEITKIEPTINVSPEPQKDEAVEHKKLPLLSLKCKADKPKPRQRFSLDTSSKKNLRLSMIREQLNKYEILESEPNGLCFSESENLSSILV
ncbi:hypothetical protein EIN_397200 [Entamoeba invadens IP1]|uniref:CBM20 domain-containing protein n=1 Tax=Entamoeba invadens IP1 TaxID=370355 RepID=A0A0A1UA42_ENTIV|nr:hypothetical protein EIN_397200 [Entamoeba invadens IP1]ELP91850.1 hypothetical protein EIN_397200 [Entamoeba invadens IP1]|eukprot:XP_004258621.1 hypothetical protein EIN_397200 [Entamoeba invadens IP1]